MDPVTRAPSSEERVEAPEDGGGEPRSATSALVVCPHCETEALHPLPRGKVKPRCPACGFDWPRGESDVEPDRPLESCAFCGNEDFYVQKDFNRQIGLFIVLASFLVVFLVMLLVDHRVGIYLLFALAVADFLAYSLLRNVTVCYLCQSVFRGFPVHPEHRGFALECEEKYKRRRPDWVNRLSEPK